MREALTTGLRGDHPDLAWAHAWVRNKSLIDAIITSNTRVVETVELLLSRGARIDSRVEKTGCTPLHLATLHGDEKIIEVLVKWGAGVNECCRKGTTPLHTAAVVFNSHAIEMLIRLGADVNLCDKRGNTALDTCLILYQAQIDKTNVDLKALQLLIAHSHQGQDLRRKILFYGLLDLISSKVE